MAVSSDVLERIRKFSVDCNKREEEHGVSEPPSAEDWEAHERRLDRALTNLQEQVRRQDESLRQVSVCPNPLHGQLPRLNALR